MMFSDDLSTITGWKGYDEDCSVSEFKELLKVDLASKSSGCKYVFWKQSDKRLPAPNLMKSEIPRVKIKRVLRYMASGLPGRRYLAQFWAPEVDEQQHIYLTTSDQPFAVGYLCKGYCWYRQHCMSYRYRVDKGAQEEELGAVGRVYKNKHLESSLDLRLYSTKEFPLRDYAACCGVGSYFALPVFDFHKKNCYGVIEVLSMGDYSWGKFSLGIELHVLQNGLKAVGLRSAHHDLNLYVKRKLTQDVPSEITEMLKLAVREVPQLQMAQVWVPCRECSSISNNLSCMEKGISQWGNFLYFDHCMQEYDWAYGLHNLEIGKHTAMISAVMLSNNKACICRNICDFSRSENPLAHYFQKARLSFCFAIYLESFQNSRDFYVVEFFMQCTSVSAFVGSFLPMLLRIMEMKLKNFNFAYKGQREEELVVEVLKENMLSSGESSQSNALRYEFVKYKHQQPKEFSMLVEMQEYKETYLLSDFTKYLQKADLSYLIQPSGERRHGWVFWGQTREKIRENVVNTYSSLSPDRIEQKIKNLIINITSERNWGSYAVVQFWAPKMDVDRCYLETLTQPFAFGGLHKGLAYFRKQCMEHQYYVDDGATEEELGPPGRVFRNRHPEITPDLRLYSRTEFPHRNHAAHCGLRKYFALPVFNSDQPKCVGVLELVGISRYSESAIEDALKAANLTSTHINFKPSFMGSRLPYNGAERRGVKALNEIQQACILFAKIPQLHRVEVWVPYNKCPCTNNELSCMERVLWPIDTRLGPDSICQIRHVETRKGIAGIALASENKSCFCRDLCGFGIADQPFAHYALQDRLDVSFAICLQSCGTGDLLYLLEFYLSQGPREYKYFRSFLCFLLQIMKQKLQSFKVASGQQLGERLVVDVIEFSEENELAISELDQPDSFPIAFRFVKYGGQKLSKDKEVLFAANCMESVTSTAQTEHCKDVAKQLGVSRSTIKRRCRYHGMQRLPYYGSHKKNPSYFMGSESTGIAAWQKGKLLGRGSYGSVYEGIADDGFFFAVKEVSLLDQGDEGKQCILQLEQEIALLSQLQHENIVQYYGTATDESHLYIFLELVNQGSLFSLYQKYILKDSAVSGYTSQILHGLKYLHDRNVVHRDIKCANILVDTNGSVKLADFGLAKATKLNDAKSSKGTAFWMAPEVVRSHRYGQGYGLPADIWSLGCTVLEMLTRQFPYANLECMQAIYMIGNGKRPPIPDSLSSDARDFIHRCLQIDPSLRPTAAQLLDHPFVSHHFARRL